MSNVTGTANLSAIALVCTGLFVEHCFLLLPLTLDCASQTQRLVSCFLPVALYCWLNYAIDSDSNGPLAAIKKRVLVGSFAKDELKVPFCSINKLIGFCHDCRYLWQTNHTGGYPW